MCICVANDAPAGLQRLRPISRAYAGERFMRPWRL